MSRNSFTRSDRFAQMSKQEEIIARKRQEILEKQRTTELGKAVAAAQSFALSGKSIEMDSNTKMSRDRDSSFQDVTQPTTDSAVCFSIPKFQNTFCNDGSFLTHFQNILESTMEKEQNTNRKKTTENQSGELGKPTLDSGNNSDTNSTSSNNTGSSIPISNANATSNSEYPNLVSYEASTFSSSYPDQNFQPNRYFNPSSYSAIGTSVPPPPPPPPQLIQNPKNLHLYMIPPPNPMHLNSIPQPKELDLNTIPKPTMNIDAIKVPTTIASHGKKVFSDNNHDSDSITIPTTLQSVIDLVAENGDEYEDTIRNRKHDIHPSLWFLFEPTSEEYLKYRSKLNALRIRNNTTKSSTSQDDKYDPESVMDNHDEDSDEEYMKGMMNRNRNNLKRRIECRNELSDEERIEQEREKEKDREMSKEKKRKSRWGDKVEPSTSVIATVQTSFGNQNKPLLSAIQRTDPALLQYARQNYGCVNLSEEDWLKCEGHFKVNLLYQDMMKKRQEIDHLATSGKFKYEYDSDEDINGGTWEHKLRNAEMEATQAWAQALNKQTEGKHHIGDFLPPEELKKFMEQYDAKKNNRTPDLSDYKEYKLKEDNIGFQMLQKLGWKKGEGLGTDGSGIVNPINKAPKREGNQGLGVNSPATLEECDNEYDAYRKRMMLAYRFRPNPLNNPRRAYY